MEYKQSYYAIIPAEVRYDKNISPNAKLLYGEITALCNEKGFCWANSQYFMKLYGVGKTTVKRWINELTENGHILRNLECNEDGRLIIERRLIPITNKARVGPKMDPIILK